MPRHPGDRVRRVARLVPVALGRLPTGFCAGTPPGSSGDGDESHLALPWPGTSESQRE